jgi:Cdc6-like AAA superfamily ATPase
MHGACVVAVSRNLQLDVSASGHGAAATHERVCTRSIVQAVRNFIVDAITHDPSGTLPRPCLYVAGVPGVGKTASVLEVVRTLLTEAKAGQVPAFQFAEVNALRLPSTQHAYSRIAEILTGALLACWPLTSLVNSAQLLQEMALLPTMNFSFA